MKTFFISILFLLSLNSQASFLCTQVHQIDYLFGLEFTFSNAQIVSEGNRNPKAPSLDENPLKKEHWENWLLKIQKKCLASGDCTTDMGYDKHDRALIVSFEDGFFFTVGSDSAALEVNAKPYTTQAYHDVLKRMDEYVFKTAKEVGLVPHDRAGGGHIHISRKAFEEKTLAFQNFLVDFQNRPELIYGALGNHLGNSAPLAALKPAQRDAFQNLLNDFNPKTSSINELVRRLSNEVFTEGYIADWGHGDYYQAFNMTRMMNDKNSATLEIRSFRPQESVEAFQLQIYLLETWVNKIKIMKEPIPYIRKDRHEYTGQEIVDAYAQLLESLNLPWDRFSVLLPSHLRQMRPKSAYRSVPYSLNDFATEYKNPNDSSATTDIFKKKVKDKAEELKSWIDSVLK
ncbi:MAG: hypothetical protein ACAH59_08000 [Pseudobdellovibrionaceae bacterium]